MQDVFTWYRSVENKSRPFLVMGKGPSFSLRDDYSLSDYTLISLNHVVREQKVDIAHMIDIDVVEQCGEMIEKNTKWLLMPWVPHRNCRPTNLSLMDYVATIPLLNNLNKQGRLLWYPLWSGPKMSGMSRVQGTFSGSVIIDLLSKLNVKKVRSIGLDGGGTYSDAFKDIEDITLFINGKDSYDVQFSEIKNSVRRSGMDYSPLVDPIRVFIGCDDYSMVAGKTLEYSIRKHTKHPVEVFYMKDMPLPTPKHKKNRPGTGFSFNRFLIPKMVGYTGKAIWLDADMLVFDDISKLWNIPFNGKKVLCSTQSYIPKGWENGKNNTLGEERYWTPGRQLSVMLLDCENLDWDVDEIIHNLDNGKYSYKDLMTRLCIVDEDDIGDIIPNEWNCLEWYEKGRSKLVHFTVVPTQPWGCENNTLNDLWESAFKEAVKAGDISVEYVRDFVNKRLIKPSLLDKAESLEIKKRVSDIRVTIGQTKLEIEAERLRHMLWDSMIESNNAKKELARIKNSPLFFIENWLIRKPLNFMYRAIRWLSFKLRLSFQKASPEI